MTSSSSSMPLRCKCRRKAVTSLRCSRCSVPICPDCSIVAPVGMLCRECGSPRRTRLTQVSAGTLLTTSAACLGAATLIAWMFLGIGLGFGFFSLWLGVFYGGFIAELALRLTGRKRGLPMEILVGTCTGAGLLLGWLLMVIPRGIPPVSALWLLFPHSPLFYVMVAIAVASAVSRIRYV